ncbi:hypothetical protein EUGRSUZ_A02288 [Eucalyptus grandis]|uniref:Uncharacterized protein n=2 Tax=Eucalyptus grandis TaxID=71139 RepID=A0ACC3M5X0_EUCGR|nr:hypothetical protein EUGRSUZ_A02288 [Eucalyptus grandis]
MINDSQVLDLYGLYDMFMIVNRLFGQLLHQQTPPWLTALPPLLNRRIFSSSSLLTLLASCSLLLDPCFLLLASCFLLLDPCSGPSNGGPPVQLLSHRLLLPASQQSRGGGGRQQEPGLSPDAEKRRGGRGSRAAAQELGPSQRPEFGCGFGFGFDRLEQQEGEEGYPESERRSCLALRVLFVSYEDWRMISYFWLNNVYRQVFDM